MALGVPVVINTAVDPANGYRILASVRNTSQVPQFLSASTTLWGAPGDPRHDTSIDDVIAVLQRLVPRR